MTHDELVKKVTKILWYRHHEWGVRVSTMEEVVALVGEACAQECEHGSTLLGANVGLGIAWERIRALTQPETTCLPTTAGEE